MDSEAQVIWGARVDPALTGIIRVMILVTSVKSKQVVGNSNNLFLSPQINKMAQKQPSLADDFFNINEIRSINEERLNIY